jgi:hypothetical protein
MKLPGVPPTWRSHMNSQERDHLVGAIASRVADYRLGEIERIDEERILAWLCQFDDADRPTILCEIERLLGKTYISREHAKGFIASLVTHQKLTGNVPMAFWKGVGLLNVQDSSRSQRDMLALLGEVLMEQFGLTADQQNSTNRTYVYLDDVLFSGNQIKNDLLQWAEEQDIRDATIHVITMASHRGGEYYAKQRLSSPFKQRNITSSFWTSVRRENRLFYARDAEVLWPTRLPDEEFVNRWKATFPAGQDFFHPRPPGGSGSTELFSSEVAQDVVEQAFLKKGAYIYSLSQNPSESMRPLGYSRLRSPGFGTTAITYRNCPNNAPLVLWWGDPKGTAPLNRWTPLLPRRPRSASLGFVFDDFDF